MTLADKKIIRIEPTNPTFTINWNIGLRCNFDCMYCPDFLHNQSDTDTTLAEFQTYWRGILEKTQHKNLKYKITFTGGEVTINKDLLPFVKWLDANYSDLISECGFTTNGSASKQYYLDAISIGIVTYISFSTHSEFFNENKFFTTVIDVNKLSRLLNKSIYVNIMDEYWNKDKSKLYSEYLTKNNVANGITAVVYEYKTRDTVKVNPNKQEFNFSGK